MPTTSKTHLPPIRVALVDDDIAFQITMIESLASEPDILLLAVAGTLHLGLELLSGPQMDVLIVDLGLPDGSGIDIIRAANEKWPECNLMVSTIFGDECHVIQSLEAGATGYLLKDGSSQNLAYEIRSLHSGGSPISPLIARKILTRFKRGVEKSSRVENLDPFKSDIRLSSREQEVLEYITKGFSFNEISSLMTVSPHTVLTFVRRIYAKLKVNSKTEAIYEARNQGLLG